MHVKGACEGVCEGVCEGDAVRLGPKQHSKVAMWGEHETECMWLREARCAVTLLPALLEDVVLSSGPDSAMNTSTTILRITAGHKDMLREPYLL